jgi:hypothetical protein
MFCPNCGFDLPEGSKFCLSCGNKIPEINVPPTNVEEKEEPNQGEWQDAMSDLEIGVNDDDIIPMSAESITPDDVTIAVARPQPALLFEEDGDNMTIAVTRPPAEKEEPPQNAENDLSVYDHEDPSSHKNTKRSYSSKPPSAFATVLSVILSILIFFTASSAIALGLLRDAFSEDSISDWVEEIDVGEIDISMFSSKYDTVSELLRDFFISQDKWNNLSEKKVELLLKKNSIKDFVEDTLVEYSEFIFEGKTGKGLTTEVIIDFMQENENSFLSTLDPRLEGIRLKFNYDDIEGMLDENLGDALSLRAIKNNNRTAVSLIQFFASSTFNVILWALCLVFIGLLALLNLKRIQRVFNYVGIPMLILGIILTILYITLRALFGIGSHNIISILITPFANNIIGIAMICLGTGIASIAAKITIDMIQRKKARKYALT